jgi:hypothetical protein
VAIFSILIRIENRHRPVPFPRDLHANVTVHDGANAVTVEPGAPVGSAGGHHRSFGKKEF